MRPLLDSRQDCAIRPLSYRDTMLRTTHDVDRRLRASYLFERRLEASRAQIGGVQVPAVSAGFRPDLSLFRPIAVRPAARAEPDQPAHDV